MTDGVGLAEDYYRRVVLPLVLGRWPGLSHAAGRLGGGSDVLGLDDGMSRDHDWGLRLTFLVQADRLAEVDGYLEESLPDRYAGWPTRFATTWDGTVRHRIEVTTAERFTEARLGLDMSNGPSAPDWLCLTGQSVLEVTSGPVFHDGPGTITRLRQELAWYPHDVWCYVVAADWIRLGEDLPLLGRTGQRGDELGHRLLAGRIVSTSIHLAFLLSRVWSPYPKWLGTAFARVPIAEKLTGLVAAVQADRPWPESQQAVAHLLAALHQLQAESGLVVDAGQPTEPFFDRPFLGIRADVSRLLLDAIEDPQIRALPPGLGSVEQWVGNVGLLTDASARVRTARAQFGFTHGFRQARRGPAGAPGSAGA